MKEDLQDLVNHWLGQSLMHEQRSVTQQSSPSVHGELLLVLRVEMAVTLGSRSESVNCAKIYNTYENYAVSPTSPGDCFRFSKQSMSIDDEFDKKYNALLDQMFRDQYGEAFS